jgi:polar amino acid transport system ATP-binding protein
MIRFEGVHKWFKKLHVLNDVNLHVKQGEVLVVCGPSGSGKSTLIRTVNSLEQIDKGKLIVDGQDLSDRKTDINKLRAEIGFVFQQFNLYPHLSVIANITLAPVKIRNIGKRDSCFPIAPFEENFEDLTGRLLQKVTQRTRLERISTVP